MGLSIKLAPGVRVRASSRGVGASLGPRAARVHMSSRGRVGVSTGVGPMSLYSSIGAGSRGAARRSPSPSPAALAKAEQADVLASQFDSLLRIHQQEFAPAQPPVFAGEGPVDDRAIRKACRRKELEGVGLLKRRERADAKERARKKAERTITRENQRREARRVAGQLQLDGLWQRLLANDEDVVLQTLDDAFRDNALRTATLGLEGDHVLLVMAHPDPDIVPDLFPGVTAKGNVSIRKTTKTQRGEYLTAATLGNMLVTLRETFAVAPKLSKATLVVVGRDVAQSGGPSRWVAVAAGVWTRSSLWGAEWSDHPFTIAKDTAVELLVNQRRTRELAPLDLSGEPEIESLISLLNAAG